MPETESTVEESATKPIRPPRGLHTNATMKSALSQKTRYVLPNGSTATVQATSVLFNGAFITDLKELPTDAEIDEHRKDVVARRSRIS